MNSICEIVRFNILGWVTTSWTCLYSQESLVVHASIAKPKLKLIITVSDYYYEIVSRFLGIKRDDLTAAHQMEYLYKVSVSIRFKKKYTQWNLYCRKKKLFRDIPEGNEKCGWKIERRARL